MSHTPTEAITLLRDFIRFQEHKGACVGLAEACLNDLEQSVTLLLEHRCEVGLENPDAMLAHLQALSPEDKAELETLMTRRRR